MRSLTMANRPRLLLIAPTALDAAGLPIRQSRDANQVTVRISRQRPVDAICTQIAKLFDSTIQLEGAFPPGSYALDVNHVRVTFDVR